jgi:hypothetical protein
MPTLEINPNDKVFKLIPQQWGFLHSKARYPGFIGAWGVGKSLVGIGRGMRLSEQFPNNLGVIFRKEYEDLKDSTVKDFQDYTGLKVDSGREVKLSNGSIIMFRHLEEMNNIQNINLGWFWIEQAEELDTDDQFFKLFGRLRRKDVDHSGFITANTNGHNWIYKLWKLNKLEGGELFEAQTADNAKNLSPEFLKSLEIIRERKPRLYNRFVLNSWDDADTVDIIIQPAWVEAALTREVLIRTPIRRVVSIDVARFGDDKTVFYAIEGDDKFRKVIGKEVHEKKNNMEVVGLASVFAKKHGGIESFAVDEIGVGSGVVDRLQELEFQVIPVNSSVKEGVRMGCFNRRAEVYVSGSEAFEAGHVQLIADDDDAREELPWARYKTIKSNGIYQVEPKDDIKERYGRSPDHADALLNGLWAISRAKIAVKRDGYMKRKQTFGGGVSVLG